MEVADLRHLTVQCGKCQVAATLDLEKAKVKPSDKGPFCREKLPDVQYVRGRLPRSMRFNRGRADIVKAGGNEIILNRP